MSPPSSAAACIPAASAAADFSTHQAISPTLATAPTRSAARRIASAGSSQPIVMPQRERGRDAGDVLGVEHLDGAEPGAVPGGGRVDVGAGFGDQRRAGMVDDPVPQHPGLPGPGQGQDEGLVLGAGEDAAEVLGAAEPDRVGGGPGQGAVVQPHRRAGPAAVVQGGEPGPADGQLGEGGEPGSGPQPDHDPPPHPPHPLRGKQRDLAASTTDRRVRAGSGRRS